MVFGIILALFIAFVVGTVAAVVRAGRSTVRPGTRRASRSHGGDGGGSWWAGGGDGASGDSGGGHSCGGGSSCGGGGGCGGGS
ncbi:hypothetical protein [Streptomyces sp. TRM70350]|uniref:hypothetical protein n=1 Tax=Streptomyces sp. TRM70350 TaxID=2856165 RepID=UPI001C44A5A6|nr:hypothetical protein [Streptomyces sp. TRM70350]MBV7696162.1 hypothetical protein [Streptomyces sp. TRM70350]